MTLHFGHKFVIGALTLVLVAGAIAVPQRVAAQTYTVDSGEELIAYLYGRIAQLQALLDALKEAERTGNTNTGSSNYRIELNTFSAINIEDDEAELRSNIDLDGASYANAWFEYGQDGDLDERTSSIRITNRGDDTRSFRRVVRDLEEDERYYFRPVAEGPDGRRVYGSIRSFTADNNSRPSSRPSLDDDAPDVDTDDASRITRTTAYVYGAVDMNDYDDGDVFFVFGIDEDDVEDATDENRYRDIDTEENELMKFIVERGHDGDSRFYGRLYGLEDDTRYYYTMCVEFEDDDDDLTIMCGDIENFRTND